MDRIRKACDCCVWCGVEGTVWSADEGGRGGYALAMAQKGQAIVLVGYLSK